MTTEILRNMIYANSTTINKLKFVVMDEVHYLADKIRGAVWEEILIHLPESVQVYHSQQQFQMPRSLVNGCKQFAERQK
jgi:replicative superfamily II helicase